MATEETFACGWERGGGEKAVLLGTLFWTFSSAVEKGIIEKK